MDTLKARVRGGRLVLDEPTDLPEGTEVELVPADDRDDDLDDAERAQLHADIDAADREVREGQFVTAEELIARLDRRSS